eukprot:PhF_6_TR23748/c2_g1_i1/m.33179
MVPVDKIKQWTDVADKPGHCASHKGRGRETTLQNVLSRLVDQESRRRHLETVTDMNRRLHLLNCATPMAGAWLRAIPNKNLFLAMAPHEFRAVAQWRLYMFNEPDNCPLCKVPISKSNGHHIMCCSRPAINSRHNALRGEVLSLATSA